MPRAFTPSRSAIYGSPERQAMINVAEAGLQFLDRMSSEEIEAENLRQISNSDIAKERERQALNQMMNENASDPDSWVKTFLQNQKKIRTKVMAGVTQKGARETVERELGESFATWHGWLADEAAIQKGKNAAIAFDANLGSYYTESRQYRGETDMLAHLESGLTQLEQGHNPGGLPVTDAVATPESLAFEQRKLTRHIVGNYVVQQAMGVPEEEGRALIESANDHVPAGIAEPNVPLFGPEETAALAKQYNDAVEAARVDARRARTERATAFEQEMTVRLLSGQLSVDDGKGSTIPAKQVILANPDISPDTLRTLSNLADKQAAVYGKGEPYDDLQKIRAWEEIQAEADPKKRLDLVAKHAHGLGWQALKPIVEEIYNPTGKDGVAAATMLKDALDSIETFQKKVINDNEAMVDQAKQDSLVNLQAMIARLRSQGLAWLRANPEATEAEQIEHIKTLLAPARKKAAQEIVKRAGLWKRLTHSASAGLSSLHPRNIPPGLQYGRWAPMPTQEEPDEAPDGLVDVWADMSSDERASARRLLIQGVTPEEIKRHLQ